MKSNHLANIVQEFNLDNEMEREFRDIWLTFWRSGGFRSEDEVWEAAKKTLLTKHPDLIKNSKDSNNKT